MWQQDVLRYLTNRRRKKEGEDPSFQYGLHIQLKLVRMELGLGGDNAKLSNFVNRNKSSAYHCGFDAADAVRKLVSPMIERGEIDKNESLRNFHAFLKAEGIRDKWLDIADYEQCLIAAFSEALPRRFPTQEGDGPAAGIYGQRLQPIPSFIGRDSELDALGQALARHGAVILDGMGGIGKTQLAEEYARRSMGRYTSCQIVTVEPWFTSYRDVVRAVRFDDWRSPHSAQHDSPEACVDRLCRLDPSSLLIFDNIDHELSDYSLLRRILRDSGAHIIVTTRLRDAFPEGASVTVGALPSDEQLHLLEGNMNRTLEPGEMDAARQICSRVDGHTLAVQLLGRAIRAQSITVPDMLGQLEGLTGFAALDTSVFVHKDGLNKTMRIQDFVGQILFSLKPLDDEMRDTLRFLTLLPLQGVPQHLLTAGEFTLSETRLNTLRDHGWAIHTADDDMLRLHPVVRQAVLSELQVDSNTCTPFLAMLSQALWEPSISDDLSHLLRLASNAVDMMYISKPLRDLLLSGRLKTLYDRAYVALQGQQFWDRLRDELEEQSLDDALTDDAAAALRLYVQFCELMCFLRDAQEQAGIFMPGTFSGDIADIFDAAATGEHAEHFRNIRDAFTEQFLEEYAAEMDDDELEDVRGDWKALLQLAVLTVGTELSEYIREAGLTSLEGEDERAFVSVFTTLTAAQETLLESVSEPVFGSFLVTVLEAFAAVQTLTPFVASDAVVALTLLFILLQKCSEQIASFDDARTFRGWQFPIITYTPRGFSPAGFTYTEELWGRPTATQIYARGAKQLIVSMSRIDSDSELSEFELLGTHEVERSGQRTILARSAEGPVPDVQVDIGPWRVRIASPSRISRREVLKMARGLELPETRDSCTGDGVPQ